MGRKPRTKPGDIQSFWFMVHLRNGRTEVHEVFATTEAKAKAVLEDRFLASHPRIERYTKPPRKT
jgi:hypothetical protein